MGSEPPNSANHQILIIVACLRERARFRSGQAERPPGKCNHTSHCWTAEEALAARADPTRPRLILRSMLREVRLHVRKDGGVYPGRRKSEEHTNASGHSKIGMATCSEHRASTARSAAM